ncbi:hypothetical protein O3P69_019203 [Scylla paramamosain]|uniref:BTB domain-containing protein n=1 Tax=Scylla paramamosain TaxID=85552 RepID=A0AAW0SWS1_SCYPA
MVVVLWQNWGEHVGRQLPHFLAFSTLTDVTISVGAASLKAHRIILAFFSPFFRRMLEEVSEERPMVVVFPGVNFDALQLIVSYMYHGQVNVPADILPAVIDLAKMLKVKGLIELPAHLDSVIGASNLGMEQNTLTNTHTEDVCLEAGEGVVELEVSAGDPLTPHLAPTSTTTTTSTTITTTAQPDVHRIEEEEEEDEVLQCYSSAVIYLAGVLCAGEAGEDRSRDTVLGGDLGET